MSCYLYVFIFITITKNIFIIITIKNTSEYHFLECLYQGTFYYKEPWGQLKVKVLPNDVETGIDESLDLVRKIESRKRNFSLDLENRIFSFLFLLSIF